MKKQSGTRSRVGKKPDAEMAGMAGAGAACAAEYDPIFSFHGDPVRVAEVDGH